MSEKNVEFDYDKLRIALKNILIIIIAKNIPVHLNYSQPTAFSEKMEIQR